MLQITNVSTAPKEQWRTMIGSEAIGLPLVKDGAFAADMLRFEPQQQTSLHTHPGSHILFVVAGGGSLIFGDETHPLLLNTCYFVPGYVPHRVCAGDRGLALLSVSSDHRPVDSPDRLEVVAL